MREIKFRAWNDKDEWMEDFFWVSSAGMAFDSASQTYDTPNSEIEENLNLIVMQYTGLKDKNGVEIYEGDIVNGWTHNPSEPHVVKYISDKYNCGFMASSVSGHGKIHVWYDGLKIIGNIYENPELLEQSK